MKLDDSDNTSEQAKSPSPPTSTDTKIEETKKPTSKDELNVLATDSDDIITKILFELKYGKNFSGTANLKKINEATTALKTLLTLEKNKAVLEARIDCLKITHGHMQTGTKLDDDYFIHNITMLEVMFQTTGQIIR